MVLYIVRNCIIRVMKKKAVIFLFLLFSGFSWGQTIENWIELNEKVPVEKIYVHTDAGSYFTGDTVWFKVYLTDSRSGKLIPGAENVYVNLLDVSGNSVLPMVLLTSNGQASGSFAISDQIKPGNYLMQAYTNYLFNFNPDAHFYKQITVSRISGFSRSSGARERNDNMVADVSFLPEGGVLLENINNLVAFKAINKLGYGVFARGVVKDEKGVVVASFSTDYNGMGLFFFTPEPGKSYSATVEGFPSFRYDFNPVSRGIKIQLVNHTSKEIIVNVAANTDDLNRQIFYLVNMYRGEVLFYQSFVMDNKNKLFKFESNSLKPGINKLVLLDNLLRPISERLLFSRNFEINNLVVRPDKDVYNKRSEISLEIEDEFQNTLENSSNLSVAVIHELVLPDDGYPKNILSHLIIDSEINGYVESSVDLLRDSEVSSEVKIRLVMLTHGYGSYFWNNAPTRDSEMIYKQEAGISLEGNAINTLTGNAVKNGEITIAIQKEDEVAFLTQTTDSLGNFVFSGLFFNDTATVHVQGKNESGKMNMDVRIDPIFKFSPVSGSQMKRTGVGYKPPEKLMELKQRITLENRKVRPGTKVNKNKNTVDEGRGDDGHFRLYKTPDFVLETQAFEQSYDNVIDFMVGKVPGVDINGNDIRIRGTSSFGNISTPLFLIDGVPLVGNQTIGFPDEINSGSSGNEGTSESSNDQLVQMVRAIPINDVDKIEVLKSPQNLAVFGVKGASGVIAIYTRKGQRSSDYIGGKKIIENKIAGYVKQRQFYSPKYSSESSNEKRGDLKTLLYWNPEVQTQNGKTELRFFSSDLPGKYLITIEGIATDGSICRGESILEIR